MTILPTTRGANLALWCACAALMVGLQLVAMRSRSLPTIIDVVRALKRQVVTRWALLATWGWVGWHLFVRTTP